MVSMPHFLFLCMCEFYLTKGSISTLDMGSSSFWVKCLECALDPQLHSLRVSPLIKATSFVLYEMACAFKATSNLQSNPTCNLKEIAGL